MGAHYIGLKKLKSFSNKTGMNFIAGWNESGTSFYKLLNSNKNLYRFNKKDNTIVLLNENNTQYEVIFEERLNKPIIKEKL